MRLAPVLAVLGLLWASPAAACHHFSVWKYTFPQRCYPHSPALRGAPARMVFPFPSAPDAHAEALARLKRQPEEPRWLPVLGDR